jgi:hypothetical protein
MPDTAANCLALRESAGAAEKQQRRSALFCKPGQLGAVEVDFGIGQASGDSGFGQSAATWFKSEDAWDFE